MALRRAVKRLGLGAGGKSSCVLSPLRNHADSQRWHCPSESIAVGLNRRHYMYDQQQQRRPSRHERRVAMSMSSSATNSKMPWSPEEEDLKKLSANSSKLKRKARNGDAFAQYSYGAYCLMKDDDKEAVKWLQKAADQGHLDAEYSMGILHLNGRGVEQSVPKGCDYLLKSGMKGQTTALYVLGMAHIQGASGIRKNEVIGTFLFKNAAVQGDPEAQWALSNLFSTAVGTHLDPVAAAEWMQRAAENGHKQAKHFLPAAEVHAQRRKEFGESHVGWRLVYNIFLRFRREPFLPIFFGSDRICADDNPNRPKFLEKDLGEKIKWMKNNFEEEERGAAGRAGPEPVIPGSEVKEGAKASLEDFARDMFPASFEQLSNENAARKSSGRKNRK